MSVQALSWVLDHSPAKGSDRLVLVSIANHAGKSPVDGAWEAWPGVALIQREAGLDRTRTVQDALSRLVAAGALERRINAAPDLRIPGDRRPNLYRILTTNGVPCGDTRCAWCGVPPDAGRGAASRRDGVADDGATGCRDTAPEPVLQPTPEPVGQPLFAPPPAPAFDAFWNQYPRRDGKRVGRGKAEALWAKLTDDDKRLVLVAVGHYQAACAAGRWPMDAERWLRDRDGWAVEWQTPAAPRTGQPNRAKVEAVDHRRDAPAGRLDL